MTDLISNLSDQLFLEINKVNVSGSANVPDNEWAKHIFRENFFTTRGANRGRLPIVEYKRTNVSYENQVAERGGQVTSTWEINVISRTLYGQYRNETKCFAILQELLRNIHENKDLKISDEVIGECTPTPWGHTVTCTLTIENSWCNADRS